MFAQGWKIALKNLCFLKTTKIQTLGLFYFFYFLCSFVQITFNFIFSSLFMSFLIENDVTGRMVYGMFFLDHNFVAICLYTQKPKKTF